MRVLIIATTGIGAMLIACCFAGLAIMSFRSTYRRELAAVQADRYTLAEGYRRLSLAHAQMVRRVNLIFILITFAACIPLAINIPLLINGVDARSIPGILFGIFMCAIAGPCLILVRIIFDLLATIYVDVPVLTAFQSMSLKTSDVFLLHLKGLVLGYPLTERRFRGGLPVSFASLFLIEAIGLLCFLNRVSFLWLIPLLAVLLTLFNILFQRHLFAWTTRLQRIEQTPWAALEPRIRKWAQLAEVEIDYILVHFITRIGSVTSSIIVQGHHTLLLSNLFLRSTDWRQQDALVAAMLGLARKGAAISNSLWIVVATLISWSFLADLGAIVASLNYPTAPIIALLILPVLLIYFVFQAIFLRIRFTRQYMAVYRYAVELTGDPLAMLVSTATLNILAAVSAKTPTSLQKQMNALEQLLQQPGPRAPWADRPVPAITTFKSGVYQLTIPLVQSPPPEPIAGVPYPNTGLNFSSPEAFFTASDESPSQGTIYTE